MTDKEFRAVLDWMMCSDPWPVVGSYGSIDEDGHKVISGWLDKESVLRGYTDWIDAFHCHMIPERNLSIVKEK